jgi:hypothetical protein
MEDGNIAAVNDANFLCLDAPARSFQSSDFAAFPRDTRDFAILDDINPMESAPRA